MNGKSVIAIVLVSMISIALAFGITFLVTRGNSRVIVMQTPGPADTTATQSNPIVEAPFDPNASPVPTQTKNCTFPIDAWIASPGAWQIDTYRIGEKAYSKKEMLSVLRGNSTDARGKLLTQIFVVVLNQQNGADATGIRTAFSDAIFWLQSFPPGSTPSDGDLQKAESIASTLLRYNSGLLGVPGCQYSLASNGPIKTDRPAPPGSTFTPTASLTIPPPVRPRFVPSETSAPQPRDPQPKPTRVPPTAVPPTSVPLTSAPPTAVPPTAVPPTPVPPTAVPPTSVPQPTEVPTEAPLPTVGVTSPPAPTSPPPPPTTVPPPPTSSAPTSIQQPATQQPTAQQPTPRKTKKPKQFLPGWPSGILESLI